MTPPQPELIVTRRLPDDLAASARAMLDEAFAGDFAESDWEHALGGWHVAVVDDGAVLAHAAIVGRVLMVGDRRVGTGYVEAVATTSARQRSGLGSRVMAEIGALVRRDHEMGALGTGEHAFYEALGWERWRGLTYVRTDGDLVRSPDDDDGVMVLRVGVSADVDLAAPISCEARAGDDW